MKLFNKVAIIGTGLIGGSIALAIKKKKIAGEVVGVSRHKQSIILAKKRGAIDRGAQSIDIVRGADLVIFAAPVNCILRLAPLVSKLVSLECIVTDVGSTKEAIVAGLGKLFPNFVGSHPLAGSEKRSIENANSELFTNTLCVLTPTHNTNRNALNKVKLLWQRLGASVVILAPKAHDQALSFVSHLPHIAAVTLIDIMPARFLKFASTGLKGTTRIASSDANLWADIFMSNSKNIIENIDLLQKNLSRVKSVICQKDKEKLTFILKRAKAKRDKLNHK